jgi:hypothetical protein
MLRMVPPRIARHFSEITSLRLAEQSAPSGRGEGGFPTGSSEKAGPERFRVVSMVPEGIDFDLNN